MTKPRLQVLLLVVLLLAAGAAPSTALAFDGEIVETSDSNWAHTPHQVIYNGKRMVTANLDSIPMDCPSFAVNCRLQARLVNKCTGTFCTWNEQAISTRWDPATSWSPTPRLACGDHYWKVQTRLVYDTTQTTNAREYYYYEYNYTAEGSIGATRYPFKAVVKPGWTAGSGIAGYVDKSVQTNNTYYTSWTDVDQAAGTIRTDC